MSPPAAANTLRTRGEVARALEELSAPLAARQGAGAYNGSRHSDACVQIEAFARPLWGLVPWMAGGGRYAGHAGLLEGIARGFDPADPGYWGDPRDNDQRIVECAAVAAAVLLAPAQFVEPLSSATRAHLAAWLARVSPRVVPDSNWLFFRVLANLAAERLGGTADRARIAADLDRIETFHAGDGWYTDGPRGSSDHYVAFALHYYSLLYARLEEARDPERCRRFRERAARFARDYAAWFDTEGAALPIGRSLSYRFAQGAFWGALAWAGVEAMPWGEIKGLWLRNLRWWLQRPITDASGLLSPGYAYPNAALGEDYNSPGSPYWAFKTFLPLALAEDHPFWQAGETAAAEPAAIASQPHPRLIVCRAEAGRHVFALCAGQSAPWGIRNDAAKHAKFCYSTRFGFSVGAGPEGLHQGAHDSMLALSEDGVHFHARRETFDHDIGELHAASTWRPWGDVAIRTWLVAAPPWHARVHRIRSTRMLGTFEGGFAIAHAGTDRLDITGWRHGAGRATAVGSNGLCEIVELEGGRQGFVLVAESGTNILMPRTAIPALGDKPRSGDLWLACAVLGISEGAAPPMPFRWSASATGRRLEGPGFAMDFAG